MLKTQLTATTLGEPSIESLTESERKTFLDAILKEILKLKGGK